MYFWNCLCIKNQGVVGGKDANGLDFYKKNRSPPTFSTDVS